MLNMRLVSLRKFHGITNGLGKDLYRSPTVPSMPGRQHPPTAIGPTARYNVRAMTSAASSTAQHGLRVRLTSDLKSAMKSRDTSTSTVLRSILSEVYTADKSSGKNVSDAQIASILKKAITRRTDSASQYSAASRIDLAAAEEREAKLIASLLPPSVPDEQIEAILNTVFQELTAGSATPLDSKRSLGLLLKAFYQQVDKSTVDGQIVKQKAEKLLASS